MCPCSCTYFRSIQSWYIFPLVKLFQTAASWAPSSQSCPDLIECRSLSRQLFYLGYVDFLCCYLYLHPFCSTDLKERSHVTSTGDVPLNSQSGLLSKCARSGNGASILAPPRVPLGGRWSRRPTDVNSVGPHVVRVQGKRGGESWEQREASRAPTCLCTATPPGSWREWPSSPGKMTWSLHTQLMGWCLSSWSQSVTSCCVLGAQPQSTVRFFRSAHFIEVFFGGGGFCTF